MKCCICGTIKNIEKYLNKNLQNMELIGSLFEDYVIILYYDHSSDNTLQKIKDYQIINYKLQIIINHDIPLHYRTHRIAKGRNECISMIKDKYSDYEYFVMMDCDDKCAYNMRLPLLKNYLTNDNNWDSLSFNHPEGYYDSWALSIRPFVASCHHFKNPRLGQQNMAKIIKKTPKNKLIKCLSAFNGFAVYKTEKFIDCYYDGTFRLDYIPNKFLIENIKAAGNIDTTQDKEDCEHRHFHFQAVFKHNAKIRISPHCLFV
jgi:hypothetical protein